MKIDDKLANIFDMEKVPEQEILPPKVEDLKDISQAGKIEDDYDASRKNLQILLLQGEDALMNALEVAKSSEHPRAFEVVGNLIKQLADVNQQLMDLHKQKQNLDNPKGAKAEKNITNNSIFVGSTNELNKLISDMKKEN
jgi:hypothetical protein